MRAVPINCLREDMKLGKALLGSNGELLLSAGTALTNVYIQSIKKLNYNAVYIDDDLSKDVEKMLDIISDTVRAETLKGIKDIFIVNSDDKKAIARNLEAIKKQVENIIEEILANRNFIINIVDLKIFDDYTYFHSVNVAVLSIVIGISLGLNKLDLYKLGIGALLHDIGKVFIDKEILSKQGSLNEEELKIIKTHSFLGFQHVKNNFDVSISSYMAILDHHEKFDGTGYPNQKAGDKISLYGRIVAVADVYDALISDRPYRKALSPSEAMEYLMGASGTLFDPEIVKVFIRKIAPYPIGTCVVLSNAYTGIVLENYENYCLRPKIKVFMQKDKPLTVPFIINLRDDHEYINTTITNIAKI